MVNRSKGTTEVQHGESVSLLGTTHRSITKARPTLSPGSRKLETWSSGHSFLVAQ